VCTLRIIFTAARRTAPTAVGVAAAAASLQNQSKVEALMGLLEELKGNQSAKVQQLLQDTTQLRQ
jgi:uncharacterized ferredoxin-like protein